jgi:hypothetical protein
VVFRDIIIFPFTVNNTSVQMTQFYMLLLSMNELYDYTESKTSNPQLKRFVITNYFLGITMKLFTMFA